MSIVNFIEKFKKEKRTLFTTPTHGQGSFVAPNTEKMLGRKFFSCDYSEIEGFDNLAHPIGMIRTAQDNAAKIFGSKSTFFLTNGSTSGIVATMLAILHRGEKVLIARNCHKSVYNGLVLSGAVPLWIIPEYNSNWGIYESINLDYLVEMFEKNKDIKAFIMTNPTYEGAMSDIYRISSICKEYGVLLIVDEAHGALWNFHKALGTPALLQGADIVVQSLHKTAGALNPSALLHIGIDSEINPKEIQNALNLITTTSPSYPLLLNIDSTIEYLSSENGQKEISETIKNINRFIRSIKNIPNLEVYSRNNDVTKILIKVANMSGFELSDILFEKYGIEDELANETSVMLLTGMGTTKAKLQKLEKALVKLCAENIRIIPENNEKHIFTPVQPRVRYTPSLVWGKNFKEIDIKYSIARVSMELIMDYPPGIPILIPGEVIKKEHIEFLSNRKKTIKVLC